MILTRDEMIKDTIGVITTALQLQLDRLEV